MIGFYPWLCVSGYPSSRPNTGCHNDESDTYPVYLCGPSCGQGSSNGSTRSVQLILSSTQKNFTNAFVTQPLGKHNLTPSLSLTDQLCQVGHGQPGPSPVPASTPVQTPTAQRAAGAAASPQAATTAPGQPPLPSSQAQRPQQGQVKLTMAQLMQLTQGAQVRPCFLLSFHFFKFFFFFFLLI